MNADVTGNESKFRRNEDDNSRADEALHESRLLLIIGPGPSHCFSDNRFSGFGAAVVYRAHASSPPPFATPLSTFPLFFERS